MQQAKRLRDFLQDSAYSPAHIHACQRHIYESALNSGNGIVLGPDSLQISERDVRRVFSQYDTLFFDRRLQEALNGSTLSFRFSRRMTNSAGLTTMFVVRAPVQSRRFEIAFSVALLFDAFRDGRKFEFVNGMPCEDRLQVFLSVFEHELVHLAELLVWGDSQCRNQRFQDIAYRFFGHTDYRHRLALSTVRQANAHGLTVGAKVRFPFRGTWYVGFINRIRIRATVLVEDSEGQRYSDGKRYRKFYVPLPYLEKVEQR